jgi:hypothetical protein
MFRRREVCQPAVTVAQAVAMVRSGHQVDTVAQYVRGRRDQRAFLALIGGR